MIRFIFLTAMIAEAFISFKMQFRVYKGIETALYSAQAESSVVGLFATKKAMKAINTHKKKGDLKGCMFILDSLQEPDTGIFNNIIDAAACMGDCDAVRTLLGRMDTFSVSWDARTISSAMKAYARRGEPGDYVQALALLEESQRRGIPCDAVCYTTAISSCAKHGNWREALQLLRSMGDEGIKPDIIACNAVMNALSQGGQWEAALRLMAHMRNTGVTVDAYTYTAAITSMATANRVAEIAPLVETMVAATTVDGSGHGTASGRLLSAAPFNAALDALLQGEALDQVRRVFTKLVCSGVAPNSITFTTLLVGLARLQAWEDVLSYYEVMRRATSWNVAPNAAMLNTALRASIARGNWDMSLTVLEDMRAAPASEVSDDALLLAYNMLLASCKTESRWGDATALLQDMIAEGRVMPDGFTYSSIISSCVAAREWLHAMDVLEDMESRGVTPTIVTYNSIIEALDTAGERIRAELVYLSALRAGIYDHWLSPEHQGSHMDLHHFPVSVAKVAVMHVISEFVAGELELTSDVLVIITGRGNHENKGMRGKLRMEMVRFVESLGLAIADSETEKEKEKEKWKSDGEQIRSTIRPNPGRIVITKKTINEWIALQSKEIRRPDGLPSAHKNLFLQVAHAKHSNKKMDIKAVCPFSNAGMEDMSTVPLVMDTSLPDEGSIKPQVPTGKCPAHAAAAEMAVTSSAMEENTSTTGKCPAHAAAAEMAVTSSAMEENTSTTGKCPAHAAAAAAAAAVAEMADATT